MNASMVVSTRMRTVHPRPEAAGARSREGSSAMGRIVGDGGGGDRGTALDVGGIRAYICSRTDIPGISPFVRGECAIQRDAMQAVMEIPGRDPSAIEHRSRGMQPWPAP